MRFMTENGRQSATRLSALGAFLILLSGGCSLVAESARQAAQYMERGQYEASMRAYEALAAKNPKDGRFFYNAGVAAYVEYQRQSGRGLMELQAEAIRPDSPLAPHRESTLDAVVGVVDEAVKQNIGLACDPLVYRAVLMGIEGMVIHLQRDGDFTVADGERINAASIALIFQMLEGIENMPLLST